jgi:hypothetical protein
MTTLTASDPVVAWLLEGDPAIRWQVMRDLIDEPADVWQAEQRRTVETGWVAEILARQAADGSWQKGRWTDEPCRSNEAARCGVIEVAGRTVDAAFVGAIASTLVVARSRSSPCRSQAPSTWTSSRIRRAGRT